METRFLNHKIVGSHNHLPNNFIHNLRAALHSFHMIHSGRYNPDDYPAIRQILHYRRDHNHGHVGGFDPTDRVFNPLMGGWHWHFVCITQNGGWKQKISTKAGHHGTVLPDRGGAVRHHSVEHSSQYSTIKLCASENLDFQMHIVL